MIILFIFLLPYTSMSLVMLLFSMLFLQKQTLKRSLGFIIAFCLINRFALKLIFGFGLFKAVIHNLVIVPLAYIMVKQFRVYGLTGQIGSGKSHVSNYLKEQFGVSIISIDEINKRVLELPKIQLAIRKLFGDEVYIKEAKEDNYEDSAEAVLLDKAKIRKLIYENPEKKRKLERLTHFKVFVMFVKMLVNEKFLKQNRIVVIENALLLRFFVFRLLCYKIISICVSDQNKLTERIMKRDNCKRELVETIIKSQMTVEEFQRGSDKVIFNDGTEAQLNSQLDELFFEIAKESNN